MKVSKRVSWEQVMRGKGREWISPTIVAISFSPLSTVSLHVLQFGGLLQGRTHPASFTNYHQSFLNEVH